MKVSKYEYLFVTKLHMFGRLRSKLKTYGWRLTIGYIVAYIALHLLGSNVDPIFSWIARALIVFWLFGWIYDICQKRVFERYRS